MAATIKLCSLVVIVGLITLSHFTAAEEKSAQAADLSPAPSERCGGYYPNRYYPNQYYPNQYYPNQYPNQYYPNTGFGGVGGTGNGGYGGYGGYGGNGGLTTYYGYQRDGYYGDRNMGFGYQQGTNQHGFSRDGDRNLNYNSFSGGVNGYVY